MHGILYPKVKICCVKTKAESEIAIRYGAKAIGLVGPMPSGPGQIRNELIKEIAASTPINIDTFLLTSETDSSKIIEHYKKVNTNTIQIVDELDERNYNLIRDELPSVEIVQVIHVLDNNTIEEAIEISKFVDYILLDSGNPNLKVKTLGGTGKVHDWTISKTIRQEVDIPIYLAGGLNENNIEEAIETVQPYGIDLCSGVRTNDVLDEIKIRSFFEKIKPTSDLL